MFYSNYISFITLKGILSITNPQAKEDIPPTIEQTDPIDERNRSSIGTGKESPNCFFFKHFQIKVKLNCFCYHTL